MYKAALLGRDIQYTRSPQVHAAIASALGIELSFDVFDVPFDGLDGACEKLFAEYDGFYITKPYKNDIKRYLRDVTTDCGVNFVRCKDKTGYNTDGIGFVRALDLAFPDWGGQVNGALVLGAGGAAYAVAEALGKRGKNVYVLNRTLMNAVKLCNTVGAQPYYNQPAELIVNATSLGLHGEDALAALCVLPGFKYAYDLIYSPPNTPFLRRCKMSGAAVANGSEMLVLQAIAGDAILTGLDLDIAAVYEKTRDILNNDQGE